MQNLTKGVAPSMRISSGLFNAFLKCPTKCWLRAAGEPASGNAYAEWVKSQNESYHGTEIERLLAETPKGEVSVSPPPEDLKAAKWYLAANLAAHARMNSCVLESEVHAVERVPSEGRGRPRRSSSPFASSSPTNSARMTNCCWPSMRSCSPR